MELQKPDFFSHLIQLKTRLNTHSYICLFRVGSGFPVSAKGYFNAGEWAMNRTHQVLRSFHYRGWIEGMNKISDNASSCLISQSGQIRLLLGGHICVEEWWWERSRHKETTTREMSRYMGSTESSSWQAPWMARRPGRLETQEGVLCYSLEENSFFSRKPQFCNFQLRPSTDWGLT